MAILGDVKEALRIRNTAMDLEVLELINAVKEDLKQSGVIKIDDTNVLIKRAITLYCKANFGYDNPDAIRFADNYKMLKEHLALSSDYNCYKVTFTVMHNSVPVKDAKVTVDSNVIITNSLGVAIHEVKQTNVDANYIVTHPDYESYSSYIYVNLDKSVTVVI